VDENIDIRNENIDIRNENIDIIRNENRY